MALLDILNLIGSQDGIQVADPTQKLLATARVNEAARELWETEDFPEALEEIMVDINSTDQAQLIALPWYVEYIRGWRYFESRYQGELADKRNRYRDGVGNEIWMHRWRHVKFSSLQRDISNESVLKLKLKAPESLGFDVTIVGATRNSARTSETVTFVAGETEKFTTLNFKEPIVGITKSVPTSFDLEVIDVNDNVLSVIPNHRVFCHYHIIQVGDAESFVLNTATTSVEVLFKRKFSDMVNDYDEFLFGNKYDKAIYWKYKEHIADSPENAEAYYAKCNQVLADIARNSMAETKTAIGFTRNPFFGMPYGRKYYAGRYANPWL